jgi:hypothetical protein
VYTYHICLIHSLVLDCFHSLAIVNNAAINMGMQVTFLYPGLHSFTYVFRNSIAGPYSSSILSFLRSLHTSFHSCYANLHFQKQGIRVPFSQNPHWYLLFFVFLMVAILVGVRWNLNVFLIYISFMTKDVKHFFMCCLAICISSFKKYLFSSFAHFFIGSCFFGTLVFWAPYKFWLLIPSQIYH